MTSIFRIGTLLFVAVLLSSGIAKGGDDTVKRDLAMELFRVAGGAEMAEQISAIMLASMKQNYTSMVNQLTASQPNLTADERRAIEARLVNFDRFAEGFNTRLNQEVDFESILDQVYVPLYEKYFTEAELRKILEFQSSPTGKKAAALMPRLMQEGMAGSTPLIQPIVMKIVEEVLQQEQSIALRNME